MFCAKCGTPNIDSANFCRACGNNLAVPEGKHSAVLVNRGNNPINVIKVIRRLTGASLNETKASIDNAPAIIATGLDEATAEQVVTQLREAGAEALTLTDIEAVTKFGPGSVLPTTFVLKKSTQRNWFLRHWILTLLLAFIGIVWLISIGSSDKQPSDSTSAMPFPTTAAMEPPSANVTLHPYDLLKNPFLHKNNTISLNVMDHPILYRGSLLQYAGGIDPRISGQLGILGLRLNRMLSEHTALYDIMGMDSEGNSDPEMLGQLAVMIPAEHQQLDLQRYWEVEPMGVAEGTNAFGATLQVPLVRFWRYTDERRQP
jgi:ribosomal protein L7/L12